MRGFAQTAHCPRCGTGKPMGAEVVPIVTCTACGLGFDPKSREMPLVPQITALAPAPPAVLVHADITDSDALLSVKDSVWAGIAELLFVTVFVGYAALTYGTLWWGYTALAAAICIGGTYDGVRRIANRIYVLVQRDAIHAWEGPLPPRHRRVLTGDVSTVTAMKPANAKRCHVIVDGTTLAKVPHEDHANELAQALRYQRARIGAPVGDED